MRGYNKISREGGRNSRSNITNYCFFYNQESFDILSELKSLVFFKNDLFELMLLFFGCQEITGEMLSHCTTEPCNIRLNWSHPWFDYPGRCKVKDGVSLIQYHTLIAGNLGGWGKGEEYNFINQSCFSEYFTVCYKMFLLDFWLHFLQL